MAERYRFPNLLPPPANPAEFVDAVDYDALAARLAEVELDRDANRGALIVQGDLLERVQARLAECERTLWLYSGGTSEYFERHTDAQPLRALDQQNAARAADSAPAAPGFCPRCKLSTPICAMLDPPCADSADVAQVKP